MGRSGILHISSEHKEKIRHWLYIIGLMLAGESIYLLPYLRKTFQTSMEAVFNISSTEVGVVNAMFGILAVVSYFPSGWLADRFSARRLLTFSLLATSAGGFFMFTIPSYTMLLVLHAFWGITSILTFWAALIKATRNWGNPENQGISFGLLDGGRGAVAALMASLATTAFVLGGTLEESLKSVLFIYSAAPLVAGIIIWIVIPEEQYTGLNNENHHHSKTDVNAIKKALKMPQVWLLALIVFFSYMLYVGSFDFPAYAERGYAQSKNFGAILGTIRDWMRPVAAIGAGLLADRFTSSKMIGASFIILVITYFSLSVVQPAGNQMWILWAQVIPAALAVFSLRGIYFAMLEETGVPLYLTGISVGVVSFIGFTPDIFSHALSGWFVDHFPGSSGYRYYFGILTVVALIGLISSLAIRRYSVKRS